MKSILNAVVVALFASFSNAANVAWNSIEVTSQYPGGYSISYPCITMTGTVTGHSLTLWADAYDYMELSSSWIFAQRGDVVTVDSVQQESEWFYSADFWTWEAEEGSVHTDYPIVLKEGSSAYLAVISRTYTSPDEYDVGWVELYYDTDGKLIAKSSAIDHDGGPLVVGAIPEPTSALLMLLGGAALLLRRRRQLCGGSAPSA